MSETKVSSSLRSKEVNLRTLDSDKKSIGTGHVPPEPQVMTPPSIEIKTRDFSSNIPKRKSPLFKAIKVIFNLLVLLVVAWSVYTYVWPKIATYLTGEVTL
ncbi:MAG: hypothetical protein COU06_01135 [Candidatus Harrisonbacteria bacterium CG10_big_fil_rev_8_21_14_0_10_38_8]|uniref:Uncharacterized protein n=1 Tax=Candidatus Harrisonbacteria bacterium CG10_big_fil_rev_8_21_14_0_10_38_8 TaxID=1974582 RepID=A0A2M6WKB4_9BACT|nr:MAG: hypothetical protein COU06_01135 [Candidatus Harrisonbacteria bacterium CG10_big_fil_rev_8_21_14_0_10_38_8]